MEINFEFAIIRISQTPKTDSKLKLERRELYVNRNIQKAWLWTDHQCSSYLKIWWIAFQQTMMRRGQEELELVVSWQILIWEQKSLARLCWLSWLPPSLVVKVRPSGCGEESSTTISTANNNCLFCLSLQLMLKTTPLGFFSSWTFGSDSHWLGSVWIQLGSPAEHSTDEATRKKISFFVWCCGVWDSRMYLLTGTESENV